MSRLGKARRAGMVPVKLEPKECRRVQTRDQLPPSCLWCGGQWRRVPGGVCCFSCGRDLFVDEFMDEVYDVQKSEAVG